MSCAASRVAAVIVLAASVLVTAGAVQYVQDDYLWTKGTWRDFKLQFPLQHFGFDKPVPPAAKPAAVVTGAASNGTDAAKAEDAEGAQADAGKDAPLRRLPADVSTPELEAALAGYEGVSLRGAVRPTDGSGTPHQGAKLASGPPMRIMETDASVPKAATLIQCQVCQHFTEEAWKGLVQWLLAGPAQRLSRQRLVKYLPEICQWEVPQVFLREHVVTEGLAMPLGKDGAASSPDDTVIEVSRRHEEVTKIHELRAVRAACDMILAPLRKAYGGDTQATARAAAKEEDANAEAAAGAAASQGAEAAAAKAKAAATKEEADAMVSAFAAALDTMVSELEGIPGLGYRVGRDNAIVPTDDEADGPVLQDSCQDHNPSCGNWAKWGECDRNPKYMMGHDEWPGNCKLSCGACTPPSHVRNRFLSGRTSAKLLSAAESVVSQLERRICSDAAPCQSAVAKLLHREFANMRLAARGGDAYSTNEHGEHHPPAFTRWPASRVVLLRRASEALTGRPEAPAVAPEDARPPSQPEQALAKTLHDRCLYVDAGWWSFELCWQLHLRQFHVSEAGSHLRVETVNTLGMYDAEETATGEVEGDELPTLPANQLPHGAANSRVPYLRHAYTRGAPCEVPGRGQVRRSAELRAACSPDAAAVHLAIHEEEACRYVAVLLTPALCDVPAFKAEWVGTAAPGVAGLDRHLTAGALAEVAQALGLPGVQFSWVGTAKDSAANDAAEQGSAAAGAADREQGEEAVAGGTASVAGSVPGDAADGGGARSGAAAESGAADAADAQQPVEQEAADHLEL